MGNPWKDSRSSHITSFYSHSGKWHLGYCNESYLPTRRGFDTFFGHLTEQTDHYTRMLEKNKYAGHGYDLRRGEAVTREGAGVYSSQLWAQVTCRARKELRTI